MFRNQIQPRLILFLNIALISAKALGFSAQWVQWTDQGFVQTSVQEKDSVSDLNAWQNLEVKHEKLSPADFNKRFQWPTNLQKIVVIGDTGCRLKEGLKGGVYQDCDNAKHWPYPQIVLQMAKEKPDLIIHVGDFHYREKCSKGEICKKMGLAVGYGWLPWKLDFIEPSLPGFAVAPWLMSRGNHEDCDRAYVGYQTLIPNQTPPTTGCRSEEDTSFFRWGDLLILNVDSSKVSEIPDLEGSDVHAWKQRWQKIQARIQLEKRTGAKHIWLVTHKPVIGVAALGHQYVPVNINLADSLSGEYVVQDLELMLAGHVHNSHIARKDHFPLQAVVGNSGTMLDEFVKPVTVENLHLLGYEKLKIVSNDFGYLVLNREPSKAHDNWRMQFKNSEGKIQGECSIQNRGENCFPADEPKPKAGGG